MFESGSTFYKLVSNTVSNKKNLIFFPEKHMQISFLCFLLKDFFLFFFLLCHPPQSVSSLDVFRGEKVKGKIQKKGGSGYTS